MLFCIQCKRNNSFQMKMNVRFRTFDTYFSFNIHFFGSKINGTISVSLIFISQFNDRERRNLE